ncbi:ubiquinone/menaquinone biosynthesis C-methylase UbiE [Paenibacillus cellulosilyticus]|uniref:Ubiquinone/menaquinone biosynthesis C-methylase UbiE n=1 Tax=Paenibacillus cellulosilyticus TaxID=375489 RepID=A0A2V2YZ88_9BACL|nr:methyltransferase domain-containing protein [Paenibacillus cellulosilyticus]PWW06135.1 ubiquinone/menaquinone biosynthesis C-methylase UbiE [Paenibacillus cellulosilyticus]QKS43094.1 methyltransferase domain-containing protein [Paenibacillus cellulosilyticus]
MKHEQLIRDEFSKQAKDFSNQQLTLNKEEYLQWILNRLQLHPDMNVLDVAAGTGILSRAIAPHVKQVTSMDLSEDMIREGQRQNEAKGVTNIQFCQGNVEQMPFDPQSFHLVVSRFAFHHFLRPDVVLQQMKTVCQAGSFVCVVDMISPDDDELYENYNHFERLRDPSHTFALKQSRLRAMFEQAGFEGIVAETVTVNVNVTSWLELTKTDAATGTDIRDRLIEDIDASKPSTGMFPFWDGNELMFKQTWIKIVGVKPE